MLKHVSVLALRAKKSELQLTDLGKAINSHQRGRIHQSLVTG